VQPGECALNDPALLAQAKTVCDAASGDHRLDATRSCSTPATRERSLVRAASARIPTGADASV
jgi:hypothetical protein